MRLEATGELLTIVAFDIPCDKTRRRVGEVCKDYGLSRTQWSVFEGATTRNRREELCARIVKMLEAAAGGGRVAVYPIGDREAAWALRHATDGTRAAVVGVDLKEGTGDDR
jgi:CRISPR-associated protein Cas2